MLGFFLAIIALGSVGKAWSNLHWGKGGVHCTRTTFRALSRVSSHSQAETDKKQRPYTVCSHSQ